jgi:hypothetical protein
MAHDVITPSNPPVAPVEKKKLEDALLNEAPLDINVSQRSCEEELSKKVVRTQVDRSAWNRRLSLNPHALTIYLEFALVHGVTPKRFEKCQCEDDDVCLHC